MLRIKKNDRVMVMVGQDKGKIGKILRVVPGGERVVVEKVNVIKKASRKSQQNPQGGMVEFEGPIHISNVMLVDKKTNKPTRTKIVIAKDGTRSRIGKKSEETI